MEQTTQSQELSVIEKSLPILAKASDILNSNQLVASKAAGVAEKLMQMVKANNGKLNADLDAKLNDFIVKARERREQLEQARKPLTAAMDIIRGSFTKIEASLDQKNAESYPAKFITLRNVYAKEQAELKEAERKRIELENNKIKEKGSIRADIHLALRNHIINIIEEKKRKRKEHFEGSSLEDLDQRCEQIKGRGCAYTMINLKADFSYTKQAIYLEHHDVQNIVLESMAELSAELCAKHEEDLGSFTRELLEKKESKRAELQRMKEANEAEKQRLEQERLARIKQEQEEQERKKQAELQAAQSQSELIKSEAETLSLFNTHNAQAALSEDVAGGGSREKLIIKVNHIGAYALIFELWYKEEAIPQNYSVDDCDKTSMKQMRAFCEKLANRKKDPIKIDSAFLSYEKEVKAINKAAAK